MLERLRSLRGDWKDEIPDRVVHSNDPDNKYKIRSCWFVSILVDTCNLLSEGAIVGEAKTDAAKELIKRFTSNEFVQRKLNTAEDIAEANKLLDTILGK